MTQFFVTTKRRRLTLQKAIAGLLVVTVSFTLGGILALVPTTVAFALDTGFQVPTANAANGGGDSWTDPTKAYQNGSGFASDNDGDRHRFYDFDLGVPSGAIISGIEVAADAWSTASADSDDVTVDPTSVGNYDQWSASSGSKTAAVSSNNSVYIETATLGDAQTFVMENAGVPANSTINSVTLTVRAKRGGSSGDNPKIRLRVENGTGVEQQSDGPEETLTSGSDSVRTRVMTTNPLTGLAWTLDEVNSWTTRFGVIKTSATGGRTAQVDQISIEVDYTTTSAACQLGVDLSWNGGTTWTNEKTQNLTDTETTHTIGGASDLWSGGHSWTPGDFSNSNFRLRAHDIDTGSACFNSATTKLDLVQVKVHYANAPTLTVVKVVTNDNGGTSVAADFPLFIDGMSVTSGVASTTTVGAHTVSETGQVGYAGTIGGDCAADGTVTLAGGDNKTCTITNDDEPGTLTIVKNTIGGNGDFDYTVSGPTGSTESISTALLSGTTGALSVNAGVYAIAEEAEDAWTLTSASCDDGSSELSGNTLSGIVVPLGGDVTCTFTNTKKGSITVYKDVVAPDGETDVDDSRELTVTIAGGNQKTISEKGSAKYDNVTPGTYTIAEIGDPDFDLRRIEGDDDGDASNGAPVVVTAGQNTDVVVTNAQKQGSLTVKKVVTNPNGGAAVAGDFFFRLNDGDAVQFIQDAFNALLGENSFLMDPGSYSITEELPEGAYAVSYDNCEFNVASNGEASESTTCTITNSDIPEGQGAITVVKRVINDNGGGFSEEDFSLFLTPEEDDSFEVVSGEANFLEPNTYTANQFEQNGYQQTSISCTDGETVTDGTVPLGEQQSWTCTVTNDDIAPSLTLVKEVANDDGGSADTTDWTLSADGPTSISGEGGVESGADFAAGTYTLSEEASDGESEATDGYTPGSWSCTNEVAGGEGNKITLALGQSTTCTITNDDQPGTLHVKKVVINDNDGVKSSSDFSFQLDNGEPTPFNENGENSLSLPAGIYDVTEPSVDGYTTTYENCSEILLSNRGEETCTITNDDVAPPPPAPQGGGGGSTPPACANGSDDDGDGKADANDGGCENSLDNDESGDGPPPPPPTSSCEDNNGTTTGEVLGATTEALSLPASCVPYLRDDMKFGKKNDAEQVMLLQTFLNEEIGAGLPVTKVR